MVLMMVAFFAAGSLQAIAPSEKKDFLGEWQFESPYAPEGYQKGIFFIEEKEGVLAGEIRFGEQYKVPMENVEFADSTLKFGITVDYNYVPLKATIEDNKLKGSASTPDGDLPFEATKVKKSE